MQDLFWVNLSQPITLTATHQQCGPIVTESTTRIQECLTRLTTLLEERSLALLKCAQFDTALRDAEAILKLDPTRALGYLLKGRIYASQGRQRRAIWQYDKGLNVDDGNRELWQRVAEAETWNNKRVDFVSRLPLEIVSTNLVPLLMGDDDATWHVKRPCHYLHVSKTWRRRFMLGNLQYRVDDTKEPHYPRQLMQLSHHVHSLQIDNYGMHPDFAFLSNEGHLRKISVNGISSVNDTQFLACLIGVRDSLKYLKIELRASSWLNMYDVLQVCPDLEHLTLCGASWDKDEPISASYPSQQQFLRPALTTLELRNLQIPITHGHALLLLEHFPSLRSLVLCPCHDSSFLPMVHSYCPFLQHLEISTFQYTSTFASHDMRRCIDVKSEQQDCLRSLYVQDEDGDQFDIEHVRTLMINNCETLETMMLSVGTQQDDSIPPPALQFPRLKRLYYHPLGDAILRCFGWWVLSHAPALESLDIYYDALETCSLLLGAFRGMQQVKSLTLRTHAGGMEHWIPWRDMSAHVQQLNVVVPPVILKAPVLLHGLGQLKHLTDLSLGKRNHVVDAGDFLNLATHLVTNCPDLHALDIKFSTSALYKGVILFSTFEHLERLSLRADNLSITGILYFGEYQKLKHLTLYNTSPSMEDTLNDLQDCSPNLTLSRASL